MAQIDDLQATFNAEIFRRSVFLTTTRASYDGDPNDGAAPSILQNAPVGTWYLRDTPQTMYRKRTAGATGWTNEDTLGGGGGGVPTATEELTFTLDSGGGSDPAPGTDRFTTQAEITSHGSFATMAGITSVLPFRFGGFDIIIEMDGTHTDDGKWLGDLSVLQFETPEDGDINNGPPKLIIRSENGLTQESGTGTLDVASQSGRVVTLDSDPGYGANAHRRKFLVITSGTGAGGMRPIESHSGTSFTMAYPFSSIGADSQVQIQVPSATFQTSLAFPIAVMQRRERQGMLRFEAITLESTAGNFATWDGCNIEFDGGVITRGIHHSLINSFMSLRNVIIDGGSAGLLAIGLVNVVSGSLRSSSASNPWLIAGSPTNGVYLSNPGSFRQNGNAMCFLFAGAIADSAGGAFTDGDGVYAEGVHAFCNLNAGGSFPVYSSGNTGHGLNLIRGAQGRFDLSGYSGVSGALTGSLGDVALDGDKSSGITGLAWSDIDADSDDAAISVFNSIVVGS